MPVLSHTASHGIAILPDITVIYVFLGAFLLVLLGTHIGRRTRSMESSPSQSEKEPLINNQNDNHTSTESQSAASISEAKPRVQKPPQPSPFTPPLRAQTDPSFASFEAYESAAEMPPRRRSYTKTMVDGTEVSGEIIVAEGWRRHTKVFGGGVCKACEESEKRMSA